jgi:hypothetical protein
VVWVSEIRIPLYIPYVDKEVGSQEHAVSNQKNTWAKAMIMMMDCHAVIYRVYNAPQL